MFSEKKIYSYGARQRFAALPYATLRYTGAALDAHVMLGVECILYF